MSEKVIEVANTMYKARRRVLDLLGPDKFREKMDEYQEIIRCAMKKHDCEEIMATMEVLKVLQSRPDIDATAQMLVLAACVEMIEPMEKK